MRAWIARMTEDNIDQSAIEKAGEILKNGGLAAFPTETVYGLGGNALDAKASEKIYAAKGRPSDNPLIVHIGRMEDLETVAANVPESARKLAAACWPGPLTMILRNKCRSARDDGRPYLRSRALSEQQSGKRTDLSRRRLHRSTERQYIRPAESDESRACDRGSWGQN